jgi:hypothetical protein
MFRGKIVTLYRRLYYRLLFNIVLRTAMYSLENLPELARLAMTFVPNSPVGVLPVQCAFSRARRLPRPSKKAMREIEARITSNGAAATVPGRQPRPRWRDPIADAACALRGSSQAAQGDSW